MNVKLLSLILAGLAVVMLDRTRVTVTPPGTAGTSCSALAVVLVIVAAAAVAFAAVIAVRLAGERVRA